MRVRLAALCLALGSCQCLDARAQFGTSLFVTVRINGTGADQLEVTISGDPRVVRQPQQVNGALAQTQTLRLLLDDAQAGKVVAVHVSGLINGTEVATGDGQALAVLNYEVDVAITLIGHAQTDGGFSDAGPGCGPETCSGCCGSGVCLGGTDAGACGSGGGDCRPCADGKACVGGQCLGCDDTTCPDGCCAGSLCVKPTTANQCQKDGRTCVTCQGGRSNSCDGGGCACGPGPACEVGQRCFGNQCLCDSASCPNGCCDGARHCRAPDFDAGRCGIGGIQCVGCSAISGDSCSASGPCACGTGAECGAGQRCRNGRCECDPTTCSGCCQGDSCVDDRAQNAAACFSAGGSCAACDFSLANGCDGGCICGSGPACNSDTRCVGGQCVCDSVSCPTGCCTGYTGGVCITAFDSNKCGTGGALCTPCAGTCAGGRCSTCSTCTGGCCLGGMCTSVPTTIGACGPTDGGSCQACSPATADTCVNSQCVCGNQPDAGECKPGQFCLSGRCQCTPGSCPTGCCEAGVCRVNDDQSCGSQGGACENCTTGLANDCAGGSCRCGLGPACGAGQRCYSDGGQSLAAACICNASTCPNGCCAGNACVGPTAGSTLPNACGNDGGACFACDSRYADNCAGGTCHCGSGAACGVGTQCIAGQCVCNQNTVCPGCCSGNTCVPGTVDSACGGGGVACDACQNPERCTGRQCVCGTAVQLLCGNGSTCTVNVLGVGLCL